MKLIVSFLQMPLTVSKNKNDGQLTYNKITAGGLVLGIESLSKHMEFVWVGGIGRTDLSSAEEETATRECWEKFKCVPVFLPKDINDRHYNGFCDAILWPAWHSFPDDVCFTFDDYEAYKETNMRFADKILEKCEEGDIVWIHDYQLMLVPGIIRSRMKNVKIMFFFHTTFPDPSNIERILYRDHILKSVCQCDMVAFHLPEYVLNFKKAVEGLGGTPKLKALSIGTDPEMFRRTLREPETIAKMAELRDIPRGDAS